MGLGDYASALRLLPEAARRLRRANGSWPWRGHGPGQHGPAQWAHGRFRGRASRACAEAQAVSRSRTRLRHAALCAQPRSDAAAPAGRPGRGTRPCHRGRGNGQPSNETPTHALNCQANLTVHSVRSWADDDTTQLLELSGTMRVERGLLFVAAEGAAVRGHRCSMTVALGGSGRLHSRVCVPEQLDLGHLHLLASRALLRPSWPRRSLGQRAAPSEPQSASWMPWHGTGASPRLVAHLPRTRPHSHPPPSRPRHGTQRRRSFWRARRAIQGTPLRQRCPTPSTALAHRPGVAQVRSRRSRSSLVARIQVLALMAEGQRNDEMAAELFISLRHGEDPRQSHLHQAGVWTTGSRPSSLVQRQRRDLRVSGRLSRPRHQPSSGDRIHPGYDSPGGSPR